MLCAVLTIGVIRFDYSQEIPTQVEVVEATRFISNDGIETPTQTGYGPTVRLPHSWRADYEKHVGWYTTLFTLTSIPDRPQAVYFPKVSVDSTVYLNDNILGSVLMPSDARGRLGKRPLLLRVPVGLLVKGDNELNIRVNAQPNTVDWISEFYIGSETDLADVYARHVFHSLTVVKIIAGLLAFTAMAMGTVWLLRPSEAVYGWFAVVCSAWSAVTVTEVSDAVLFGVVLPSWLGPLLFLGLSIAILKFVDETRQRALFKRFQLVQLTGFAVVASACMYLWRELPAAHLFVNGGGVVVLLFACSASLFSDLKIRQSDRLVLWLSVFLLTLLSLSSWLAAYRVPSLAYSGLSTATAAPAFVFLVGYRLVRDFATARNELEALNRCLEQRVAERTADVQVKHQQLLELERGTILSAERERIMREMHDGMGGHLMSILSISNQKEIDVCQLQCSVTDALQDLRMMIDSLDPVEDDLGLVLGMYRQRMEKSLLGTDIELRWGVGELPALTELTPHKVLQILRILQESVTNALRHSQCRCISVTTGLLANRPFIEVQDDGKGMDETSQFAGRGLMNMHKRATTLGAEMQVRSSTQGVSVRLLFRPVALPHQATF